MPDAQTEPEALDVGRLRKKGITSRSGLVKEPSKNAIQFVSKAKVQAKKRSQEDATTKLSKVLADKRAAAAKQSKQNAAVAAGRRRELAASTQVKQSPLEASLHNIDVAIQNSSAKPKKTAERTAAVDDAAVDDAARARAAAAAAADDRGDVTDPDGLERGGVVRAPEVVLGAGASLVELVSVGDVERLREMIVEGGADPDLPDDSGCPPIVLAAKMGHVAVVDVLASLGANQGARDDLGRTALHVAAQANQAPVVKQLLEMGANVNELSFSCELPIHGAARGADGKVIDMLVEAGSKVSVRTADGKFPSYLAERRRNFGLAAVLRAAEEREVRRMDNHPDEAIAGIEESAEARLAMKSDEVEQLRVQLARESEKAHTLGEYLRHEHALWLRGAGLGRAEVEAEARRQRNRAAELARDLQERDAQLAESQGKFAKLRSELGEAYSAVKDEMKGRTAEAEQTAAAEKLVSQASVRVAKAEQSALQRKHELEEIEKKVEPLEAKVEYLERGIGRKDSAMVEARQNLKASKLTLAERDAVISKMKRELGDALKAKKAGWMATLRAERAEGQLKIAAARNEELSTRLRSAVEQAQMLEGAIPNASAEWWARKMRMAQKWQGRADLMLGADPASERSVAAEDPEALESEIGESGLHLEQRKSWAALNKVANAASVSMTSNLRHLDGDDKGCQTEVVWFSQKVPLARPNSIHEIEAMKEQFEDMKRQREDERIQRLRFESKASRTAAALEESDLNFRRLNAWKRQEGPKLNSMKERILALEKMLMMHGVDVVGPDPHFPNTLKAHFHPNPLSASGHSAMRSGNASLRLGNQSTLPPLMVSVDASGKFIFPSDSEISMIGPEEEQQAEQEGEAAQDMSLNASVNLTSEFAEQASIAFESPGRQWVPKHEHDSKPHLDSSKPPEKEIRWLEVKSDLGRAEEARARAFEQADAEREKAIGSAKDVGRLTQQVGELQAEIASLEAEVLERDQRLTAFMQSAGSRGGAGSELRTEEAIKGALRSRNLLGLVAKLSQELLSKLMELNDLKSGTLLEARARLAAAGLAAKIAPPLEGELEQYAALLGLGEEQLDAQRWLVEEALGAVNGGKLKNTLPLNEPALIASGRAAWELEHLEVDGDDTSEGVARPVWVRKGAAGQAAERLEVHPVHAVCRSLSLGLSHWDSLMVAVAEVAPELNDGTKALL